MMSQFDWLLDGPYYHDSYSRNKSQQVPWIGTILLNPCLNGTWDQSSYQPSSLFNILVTYFVIQIFQLLSDEIKLDFFRMFRYRFMDRFGNRPRRTRRILVRLLTSVAVLVLYIDPGLRRYFFECTSVPDFIFKNLVFSCFCSACLVENKIGPLVLRRNPQLQSIVHIFQHFGEPDCEPSLWVFWHPDA